MRLIYLILISINSNIMPFYLFCSVYICPLNGNFLMILHRVLFDLTNIIEFILSNRNYLSFKSSKI